MIKMRQIISAIVLSLSLTGCSTEALYHYSCPSSLLNVERDMKRPGFWVSRQSNPDSVIMDEGEIKEFNTNIRETLGLTKDITRYKLSINGGKFKSWQLKALKSLEATLLYTADNNKVGESFYKEVTQNLDLENVPDEIAVRFGFITNFADHRVLPTEKGLYEKPNDLDFDKLQSNGLDIGTPVAILHTSRDGKWIYVDSSLSDGWVESCKVAFCELKEMEDFLTNNKPVVVTDSKSDVYLEPEMKTYYGYVRMGAVLAFLGEVDEFTIEVLAPIRDNSGEVIFRKCYMMQDAVNVGYLPYTARTIIEEAFKLLNEPYGWGDMRGEQDCSRFIQQIFATTGIALPRNSSSQGKTGLYLAEFDDSSKDAEKLEILKKKAVGGLTILYMKGHIMLFLGIVGDKPYAIHATWAYRENISGKDTVRLINRVVVTDLSLGKGSKKRSLLERLTKVRIISK